MLGGSAHLDMDLFKRYSGDSHRARDEFPGDEFVTGPASKAVVGHKLYQPAETLTPRRHRLRRARRQYPIGLPYIFAMDVPVGRRQHESGSASFGIRQPASALEFATYGAQDFLQITRAQPQ